MASGAMVATTGAAPADAAAPAVQPDGTPVPKKMSTLELLLYLVRKFAKGFLVGYNGKLLLGLLPIILRLRPNNFKSKIMTGVIPKILSPDTRSYGYFFGGFLVAFHGLLRVCKQSRFQIIRQYRGAVAGGAAGLSLALAPQGSRTAWAIFFFVRALEVLSRSEKLKWLVPQWDYNDLLVMTLSSGQVAYAWMFAPHCLPATYIRFLEHQGYSSKPVYDAISALHDKGQAHIDYEALAVADPRLARLSPTSNRIFCDMAHPEFVHCNSFLVKRLFYGFFRALPVYLPIYVVPLVLFNRKALFKAPLTTLGKTVLGVSRSALFLSGWVTFCWRALCAVNSWPIMPGPSRLGIFIGGCCAGGFSLPIERKDRRMELAMYLFTLGAESFYRINMENGWAPNVPHAQTWLFSFAMAVMMHAFITAPQRLRSSYRSLFKTVVGLPMDERHDLEPAHHHGEGQSQLDKDYVLVRTVNKHGAPVGVSGAAVPVNPPNLRTPGPASTFVSAFEEQDTAASPMARSLSSLPPGVPSQVRSGVTPAQLQGRLADEFGHTPTLSPKDFQDPRRRL